MKKAKRNFNNKLITILSMVAVLFVSLLTIGFVGVESFDLSGLSTAASVLATVPVLVWFKNDKFVELDESVLKTLSAEELAEYYNAYNANERKNINAAIEAKASKEDIENMKVKLQEIVDNQYKTLEKIVENQGLTIKKMQRPTAAQKLSAAQHIANAMTEKMEDIKGLQAVRKNGFITLDLKAAGTMLTTTNITGGNVPVEDREAGLNRIARRRTWVLDAIQQGDTFSRVVSWVEQQNPDGGAGGTVEGDLKNLADFDLVVVDETIKKRTVKIKISDEMLADIPFMASEVDTELTELLSLDIDDQLLNGDNLGQNLNGIITQATAFAAGTFANTVDDANNWDVLQVAINQVRIANHNPNVIFMHPSDVTAMKLVKGSDGHYVMPPFIAADGMQVDALPIVENTGIAVDNFLVMDGTKAKAFWRERMNMQVGWENDDFTRNLVTILAEARLLIRIKGNDLTAFITGDFTTAKAALETP